MEPSPEEFILKKTVDLLRNENNAMNLKSSLIENVVDLIEEKIGEAKNTTNINKFGGEKYTELECSFNDIIGLDTAKRQLYEQVVLQLSLDSSARNYYFKGIRNGSSNVLLFGPPGTGKTLLARAVAFEASATLFTCTPSSVLSKYNGESEARLKSLFDAASYCKSAIIFFDEFDSIALERGSTDDNLIARRLLAELLVLLTSRKRATSSSLSPSSSSSSSLSSQKISNTSDTSINTIGSITPQKRSYDSTASPCSLPPLSSSLSSQLSTMNEKHNNYVVIAATNRVNDLDEAILRRFPLKILIEYPDITSRKHLIAHFLEDIEWSMDDDELIDLAEKTQNWTGSEIESLCRDAAMAPLRPINFSLDYDAKMILRAVTYQDFIDSFSSLLVEQGQGTETVS